MTVAPLLAAGDLTGFGALLPEPVVQAACELVRNTCGWHIAPPVTETVVVEATGGRVLLVPRTLHLTDVTAVRDVTADPAGYPVTTFNTYATEQFHAGIVSGAWPYGVLEVDIEHGYDTCPADLQAAVYEIASAVNRGDLASRSLGDLSESWRDVMSSTARQALDQYRIPRSA